MLQYKHNDIDVILQAFVQLVYLLNVRFTENSTVLFTNKQCFFLPEPHRQNRA